MVVTEIPFPASDAHKNRCRRAETSVACWAGGMWLPSAQHGLSLSAIAAVGAAALLPGGRRVGGLASAVAGTTKKWPERRKRRNHAIGVLLGAVACRPLLPPFFGGHPASSTIVPNLR